MPSPHVQKPDAKLVSQSQDFLENLQKFSKCSFEQCAKDCEAIVVRVSDILTNLISDAERVSKMSKEALFAIHEVKSKVGASSSEAKGSELMVRGGLAKELISALQILSKEDLDFQSVAIPVIEALQFQDRIRQKMENSMKMLQKWIDWRADAAKANVSPSDLLINFGNELLSCATTPEERVYIRAVIPGLPEETLQDSGFAFL